MVNEHNSENQINISEEATAAEESVVDESVSDATEVPTVPDALDSAEGTDAGGAAEQAQPEAPQPEVSQPEVSQPEAPQPEAAQPEAPQPEAAQPEAPQLLLPLSEMTPAERFRATARLIFLAPDVPPVQPRQRRSELRQLDDMLDRQFSRGRDGRDSRDSREGRDSRDSREGRDNHDGHDNHRDSRDGRDSHRDGRDSRDSHRESRDSRDSHRENYDGSDSNRDGRDNDDERDTGSNRRRNRRRSGSDQQHDDESSRRESRTTPQITEPQRVKGSTRLEAKKQRRRDGRETGRRRRLVITESEFLARRESVAREMIVRTTADRIQIGVLEDKVLVEHYVARSSESSIIGNVYLGRVQNVLPSMEAAFVDIGRGRNAVLYSGEVDWSEFEGSSYARKIENVLKPGDLILVQVTKDPVGHKGARLTSQVSLPGRFLVYVPGGAMNGISRKLPDTERARLKKILKEVLPSGAGVIVRTAAEGATEEQVTGDVQRLTRQWDSIQQRVTKGTGPVLLHSEPDMLIKIVRDVFNEDFHKLIIQGEDTYQVIADYLSQVAPELLERVTRYENTRDIFDEFRINEQIVKALDRKVWLPSGGSLVIDRTEAMTVVDVNTGKFVGSGGNLEETVTKNNLESAEEIVRQLRLRDIGGIIVIDFIDMVLESNRDLVLRRLVECLSRDRTKHQVAEVTSLGLVQMTRKKLGLGLLEAFSEPCDTCAGRGIVVHHEPVHRHRSEAPSRGKRKGGSQQTQQATQAHAITDESRNAMAKIAASTISGAADHSEPAESTDQKAEPKSEGARSSRSSRSSRQSRGDRSAREERHTAEASAEKKAPTQPAARPAAEDLLGSVLDALPPAPEAGTRRRTSRRVSTASILAENGDIVGVANAAPSTDE